MLVVYSSIKKQNEQKSINIENLDKSYNSKIKSLENIDNLDQQNNEEETSLASIDITSTQDFRIISSKGNRETLNEKDTLNVTQEFDLKQQEENKKKELEQYEKIQQEDSENNQEYNAESGPLLSSPRKRNIDQEGRAKILQQINKELQNFRPPENIKISKQEWEKIINNIKEALIYNLFRKNTRYDRSVDIKNNIKDIIGYFYSEIYCIFIDKKTKIIKKYLNEQECRDIITADICTALSFINKRKKILEILQDHSKKIKMPESSDFKKIPKDQLAEFMMILTPEVFNGISNSFNECISHLSSINFRKFDYRNFLQASNVINIKKRCMATLLTIDSSDELILYKENKNKCMATCLVSTLEEEQYIKNRKLTVLGSLMLCGVVLVYSVAPKQTDNTLSNNKSSSSTTQYNQQI